MNKDWAIAIGSSIYKLRDRAFDLRHGIQTAGSAKIKGLSVRGTHGPDATWYDAADPRLLFKIFNNLDIDYSRYVFVDYGSGKGRALLIASEFPFRRIIGVEFALEFHELAVKNIARYRSRHQQCRDIESLHMDATQFALPEEPLVIFMFNPFTEAVLVPVLHLLSESLRRSPREVWLIYVNPLGDRLIQLHSPLRNVTSSRYHNLYHFQPQQGIAAI